MGILITMAIAVPWHILAEIKTPGFLKYYLIGENFDRFVIPGWKGDMYGSAHKQFRGMIWLFTIPTMFRRSCIGGQSPVYCTKE